MSGETNEPGSELAELFSDTLVPVPSARPSRVGRPRPRRSWHRGATAALAAFAVAGGLLPLYGDPRVTPLTHPLWARMLLQALEMDDAIEASTQASQVFGALAFKESLTLAGARYRSGEGVEVEGDRVRAVSQVGEVAYPLVVVRGGDYRMRCHVTGDPSAPVTAEIAPTGGNPLGAFQLTPSLVGGWVGAGKLHLDPGTYSAAVLLPTGTSLDYVEVSPPCLQAIEPPDGWAPRKVTSRGDLAVTALQALDAEHRLPPADVPIELGAEDVRAEGGSVEQLASMLDPGSASVQGLRLEGGDSGMRAVGLVEIPREGLYSLFAFAAPGRGLTILADGCHKAVVCPGEGGSLAWRPILTQRFEAGKHHIDLVLSPGAIVEGLRLERKQDAIEDYVTTLRSMGFDPGPEGDVGPGTAGEAVRFIRNQRREDPRLTCGGLSFVPPMPPAVPALIAGAVAGVTTGAEVTLPTGSVAPPPAIPPQQPASPVVPIGQ